MLMDFHVTEIINQMICLPTVQMNAMDVCHRCFAISEVATIKYPFLTECLIILSEEQMYH